MEVDILKSGWHLDITDKQHWYEMYDFRYEILSLIHDGSQNLKFKLLYMFIKSSKTNFHLFSGTFQLEPFPTYPVNKTKLLSVPHIHLVRISLDLNCTSFCHFQFNALLNLWNFGRILNFAVSDS